MHSGLEGLGEAAQCRPRKKKHARTVFSRLSFLEFSLLLRVFLSFMWLRSAAGAVILNTGGSECWVILASFWVFFSDFLSIVI